jgi:hypothetical protein
MRYEERLDAFAQGRRFARMSRPVRNRADSWCDACGSIQARVLFGVQEQDTKEGYFVGEHCLQELAARGAVVRRFLRVSAEEAYATRCEARAAFTRAPASPALEQPAEPASPSGTADQPALAAFLVLAAPRLSSSPLIFPLHLGDDTAELALDALRDWPRLVKRLRGPDLNATRRRRSYEVAVGAPQGLDMAADDLPSPTDSLGPVSP